MRGDVLSVRALSTIAILALLSPPVVRPVAALVRLELGLRLYCNPRLMP